MSFYDRVLPLEGSSFAQRLGVVEERIGQALERTGRVRTDLILVAVSKKFSSAHIREAYEAGLRHFGENYIQEFAGKRPELAELRDARFHFIGHLQSNKVRQAVDLFDVIQTVDSNKLVDRIDAAATEKNAQLDVLIEVKLSSEQSKSGATPEQIPQLVEAASTCRHLRLTGLMTMPPWSENAEDSRPYFRKLAALARESGLRDLSMGMSNDLEVAIEEGATIIRVGTALFGKRPKPQASSPAVA